MAASVNKKTEKSFKFRFTKQTESLMRTVCGSEFQTDDAENWKACLEKSVPMNGWTSSGMADERKVQQQAINQ